MRTTSVKVQKWGDSLAVRLPSAVIRDMRLAPGQSIEVSCRGGIITMKPAAKKEPSLRDRLRAFDPLKHAGEAMAGRVRRSSARLP